jgi:hypothetical protein
VQPGCGRVSGFLKPGPEPGNRAVVITGRDRWAGSACYAIPDVVASKNRGPWQALAAMHAGWSPKPTADFRLRSADSTTRGERKGG